MQYADRTETDRILTAGRPMLANARPVALVAVAKLPRGLTTSWLEGPAWLLGFAVAAHILGTGRLPLPV
ncbi:MAG: hypothetical protein HY331_15165 [Chloroflexi bacterium]|nr:hypothetical protein [Chloroflexota bacterium]